MTTKTIISIKKTTATMTAMTTTVTRKKRPSNTSQMTKSAFHECAAQNKRLKEKQQGLPNMA